MAASKTAHVKVKLGHPTEIKTPTYNQLPVACTGKDKIKFEFKCHGIKCGFMKVEHRPAENKYWLMFKTPTCIERLGKENKEFQQGKAEMEAATATCASIPITMAKGNKIISDKCTGDEEKKVAHAYMKEAEDSAMLRKKCFTAPKTTTVQVIASVGPVKNMDFKLHVEIF